MEFASCPSSASIDRRVLLRAGASGLLGLGLAPTFGKPAQIAARANSVIFLYQFGGPSHVDMFDLKPEAPDAIRGPYRGIQTRVPGLNVCERLPRVTEIMDKVTLVRSVHHTMKNHNSASYYALTGHAPPVDDIRLRDSLELFPAYGSVVDRFSPPVAGLPTYVALPHVIRDGSVTPGQHASFLGKKHDPLLVTENPNSTQFRLPELSLPGNLSLERLARRREIQRLVDSQRRVWDARGGLSGHYDKAVEMLSTPAVSRAFDLSSEAESVRERYGRSTYGQSCLLARRLVEAGVRFVNVYFSDNIGGQSMTSGGWDTHGFNNTRMFPIIEKLHLPMTDQTLPALLGDLDERGLLDETLVVWMGEFGRTPRINDQASRDHWPDCYSVILACGGTRRGFVHGASDRQGMYPARDPVLPGDLAATIFHLLGIEPHTEVRDTVDRPLPIAAGNVVTELIA